MRRRRQRRRGAAAVEFILVVPAFLLIWAGVTWFREAYDARLVAQQDAQQQAWRDATRGTCVPNPAPSTLLTPGSTGPFGAQIEGPMRISPSSGTMLRGVATADRLALRTAPPPPAAAPLMPGGLPLRGWSHVVCNEVTPTPSSTLLPIAIPAILAETRVR